MEVVVTTGAIRRVKLSPPTNQHPAFLQAGCPSCRPTNSVIALKVEQILHSSLSLQHSLTVPCITLQTKPMAINDILPGPTPVYCCCCCRSLISSSGKCSKETALLAVLQDCYSENFYRLSGTQATVSTY